MEVHKVKKIKLCVFTTDRADYGRLKPIMKKAMEDPSFQLQVVVGTPLFFDHFWWYLRHGEPLSFFNSLPWYLKARWKTFWGSSRAVRRLEYLTKLISGEGFPISARIPMLLEGGNQRVMTKTLGFALLGMAGIIENLKPDMAVVHGDRFEILPIAFSVAASNIPLIHVEGGDVSGTLDESTRHAITKLAHIHFAATPMSAERIKQMGEDPRHVHTVGSPIIDTISKLELSIDNSVYERNGSGGGIRIDFTKPFLLITQHPVTTRYEDNKKDMEELILAVDTFNIQKLFLAPNIDAGADGVSEALREYREGKPKGAAFSKNFLPHDFYRILKNAKVVVGNSSSFIREGAFLGTPAVIVGDRQQNRERGKNTMEVPPVKEAILAAIKKQLLHGPYARDTLFGNGNTTAEIIEILKKYEPGSIRTQKIFYEQVKI